MVKDQNGSNAVRQLQERPAGFLIVGIGASAGGIQALQEFFRNVPPDAGLAFVVILHLSPDFDSQLASVLQQTASIPVTKVVEKVQIEPNHIYVVPPSQHLTMEKDGITVSPNVLVEERRAPVDIFLRTLADEHGPRAVSVILSGTGANGSMGMKRIKERGGACYVQRPREAEFNEMPRNAIATGMVDEVLPVAQIPAKIISYRNNLGSVQIVENGDKRPEEQQQDLREVFTQLRVNTGHDFSHYKRPTLLRRIERRINIHGLADLSSYVTFLQEHAEEPAALLKDLLISVTNFFRDHKPFEALEKEVIPAIFSGKKGQGKVRIWVAGCATGEEAYSIAMLCAEKAQGMTDPPKVQIFATDIDESAIAHAREGVYTLNDAADVLPERLRRFFLREGDTYRIRGEVRETVMFATHNFLKDPPFSHLDLISCRNVMIYLNQMAQERVAETFHFALNPGGFLFLGTAESVDTASDLFAAFNRENHIFQSRQVAMRNFVIPEKAPLFNLERTEANLLSQDRQNKVLERISYSDLHQQLLEAYALPSVVVNEQYEIVHLTEGASRFLQVSGGEFSRNLLKLLKPELRLDVRSALYQAAQRQAPVEARGQMVSSDGKTETLNIRVHPVLRTGDPAKGFLLVLFGSGMEEGRQDVVLTSEKPVARELEEELTRLKAQLRSSNEQHELQAEEMKAGNEELQAMNEELRSAAAELETSREELQSINEELRTVNQELKIKVEETSTFSNNLQNLINSTHIGTIFLDRGFRVVLYTPSAGHIFNLIPSDYGRPLSDITSRLENTDLLADAETVLDKLTLVEREVRTREGMSFLMRITPYRTDEDRIKGVVATFVNITERKKGEEELRKAAQFSAFRMSLNEALQPLEQSDTILSVATRALGEMLGADRAYFAELEPGGAFMVVPPDHHSRVSFVNIAGRYPVTDFNAHLYGELLANRQVAVADTHELAERSEAEESAYQRMGIRALIAHPIVQGNQLIAILMVTRSVVHPWTGEELAMVLETAERAWAAVERFRAVDALRQAEEKYRSQLENEVRERTQELKESKDLLQSVFDATVSTISIQRSIRNSSGRITDFKVTMLNKAAHTRLDQGEGKDIRYAELYPGIVPSIIFDRMVQTAETGETQDFELQFTYDNLDKWFHFSLVKLGDGVVTISEDITLRKQAEQELLRMKDELAQKATDKYYSLFNSIDEAFAYCGILLDDSGRAQDYRFLEVNPAFGNMMDIDPEKARNMTVRELIPGMDDYWIQTCANVTMTGEPVRFENQLLAMNRWYDVYAGPVGEKGNGRFVLVFRDTTERRHRESNLAFLSSFTEELALFNDREGLMGFLGKKIVSYFGNSSCLFLEIEDGGEQAFTSRDLDAGAGPESAGNRFLATVATEVFLQQARAGEPIVVEDARHSALVHAPAPETPVQAASLVAVPLLKSGQWVFMQVACQESPRVWREDEIALLKELTTRIWARLEKARAEEALRASEERLRVTMESAVDYAIISTDTDGAIEGWNSGAEKIFQYNVGEVRGQLIDITYTPEDKVAGVPESERETARDKGRSLNKRWHVRRDGVRIFMSGVTTPIYNRGLKGYVKVATDMTEQQRTQDNLKMLEERYRAALQSAEMAAWDWDIIEDSVVWNDQHYYLLGLQPRNESIRPDYFMSFVHEDDRERVTTALQRAVDETGLYEAEFRIRRADSGEIRWMSGYGRTIQEQDGIPKRMVGVMYDITGRKQLEQQKDDFIGIASHELKTPVTSIKAYTELLHDLFEQANNDLNTDIVRKLDAQVDRLITLIYTLLDTTKIAQGQLALHPEPFSLNELIGERTGDLQRLTEHHRIVFLPEQDVVITADRERIGQVFTNLISNAIKYSPNGGDITIEWKEQPDSGMIEVSVRDRGLGIPQDMQSRVFERFYRAGDAQVQTFPGMGLGLYITANIIERHGGTIGVNSQEGAGSLFYFTIPIHWNAVT